MKTNNCNNPNAVKCAARKCFWHDYLTFMTKVSNVTIEKEWAVSLDKLRKFRKACWELRIRAYDLMIKNRSCDSNASELDYVKDKYQEDIQCAFYTLDVLYDDFDRWMDCIDSMAENLDGFHLGSDCPFFAHD